MDRPERQAERGQSRSQARFWRLDSKGAGIAKPDVARRAEAGAASRRGHGQAGSVTRHRTSVSGRRTAPDPPKNRGGASTAVAGPRGALSGDSRGGPPRRGQHSKDRKWVYSTIKHAYERVVSERVSAVRLCRTADAQRSEQHSLDTFLRAFSVAGLACPSRSLVGGRGSTGGGDHRVQRTTGKGTCHDDNGH